MNETSRPAPPAETKPVDAALETKSLRDGLGSAAEELLVLRLSRLDLRGDPPRVRFLTRRYAGAA